FYETVKYIHFVNHIHGSRKTIHPRPLALDRSMTVIVRSRLRHRSFRGVRLLLDDRPYPVSRAAHAGADPDPARDRPHQDAMLRPRRPARLELDGMALNRLELKLTDQHRQRQDHLHHREALTDALALTRAEREVGAARSMLLVIGQEPVRIESLRLVPEV